MYAIRRIKLNFQTLIILLVTIILLIVTIIGFTRPGNSSIQVRTNSQTASTGNQLIKMRTDMYVYNDDTLIISADNSGQYYYDKEAPTDAFIEDLKRTLGLKEITVIDESYKNKDEFINDPSYLDENPDIPTINLPSP